MQVANWSTVNRGQQATRLRFRPVHYRINFLPNIILTAFRFTRTILFRLYAIKKTHWRQKIALNRNTVLAVHCTAYLYFRYRSPEEGEKSV